MPRKHRSRSHLDELVPLLQPVAELPLVSASVFSEVLPDPVGLLLLLLLQPQLLPSVRQLTRQRRNRPTVTLLLILMKREATFCSLGRV